jgi:hypothetical protein
MALVLADRVRETTTTTGTGSVTLAGAYTGFQTFSAAVGNTNSTYYTIANVGSGEWEVGIGTYSSGGNLLSRTTVLASSNGGSLVNFGAGAKDVFVTQPAERALYVASAGTGLESQVTAFTNGGIVYASSTSALATGSALTWNGSNLAVTGTLSATGAASLGGSTSQVIVNRLSDATTYGAITFNGVQTNAGILGLVAISGGPLQLRAPSGSTIVTTIAGATDITSVSSTVLAVTGNTTSTTLQLGTNPAGVSIGVLGIPNQKRVYGRNAANSADVNILYVDGSNGLVLGPSDTVTITSAGFLTVTGGATIQGLTVGLGAGAVATNTAVGVGALAANTTGSFSTAIGNGALAAQTGTAGVQNIAVGNDAAGKLTTGTQNTAVGISTLGWGASVATTGTFNATFGQASLYLLTSGSYNTALGAQALYSNTTASNNTAVGYQAGYTNQTGDRNTFVGVLSGNLQTSSFNTFVGARSGLNSTGERNTFVGAVSNIPSVANYGCGELMTSGSKNTILGGFNGNQGGLDIRTASNYIVLSDGDGNPRGVFDSSGNLGIGATSPTQKLTVVGNILTENAAGTDRYINISTNGVQNTYLGFNNSGSTNVNGVLNNYSYVGNGNTYGLQILANGSVAATFDTSGNLGIGTTSPSYRLHAVSSASIVSRLGSSGGSGAFINFIDSGASPSVAPSVGAIGNNLVFMGDGSSSERARIDSSGNLLVGGTTSYGGKIQGISTYIRSANGTSSQNVGFVASDFASNEWHFGRSSVDGYYYVVRQTGTGMYMNTNAWVATSDIRAKENIVPLESSLAKINSLNPVRFTFKKDGMADVGFIAQEMYEQIPEVVDKPEDEKAMMGISKEKIIPFLVKAIQEQQALITQLTARITALEGA